MKAAARLPEPEPQEPTPEMFLEEMQRMFESGTLRGAREVAERGLALFPDHPELRRLHHELRPVKSRISSDPKARIPDRKDTFDWLDQNAEKYRGQWVAVLGTELLAASPDFQEVNKAVQSRSFSYLPLLHHFRD
jgi:hypothetical protein